ncbi:MULTISPECIES: cobalamin-binding protein [Shewanella]|uniref:Vitamin B12 transport system substrate-binding protein n=1 Tax=Shewanella fodinae TaxID=552357 RepID=A0A4R2FHX0_9GAMM|nr:MULTISPECIES: cobalamin-binding protein [Shewanella]MBO1270923.1 cobalamin-binding protein [Shewanella sp. 4t3-1-2LB]MDN5369777.1 vitamin transport system substrate-binding protein [Shewanella sp.]TCN88957.1 vitamin B12 transport system substrate-binding protein [Shewanella fodinae]
MRWLCLLLIMFSASALADVATPADVAKRIVALSPHTVELLYAIGAGEEIIATTDFANYPDAAKQIPRIGGNYGVQLDKLLALSPDLVVVWGDGNQAQDIARIRQLGLPLYISAPHTLQDVTKDLLQLGKLTGHEAKAAQVAATYQRQLQAIQQHNASKTPVKVFYQLWSNPLMTVANGSWMQQLLQVCRGDNVFADAATAYPQVSLEAVLMRQPQVIIKTAETGNPQSLNWQQWPEIPAVKNQQIYTIDADLLQRPTPRLVQGLTQLCQVLDRARSNHHSVLSGQPAQ